MPLAIVRNNITKMQTDAIVNAANIALQKSNGVCGAIFDAAGVDDLENACKKIGKCETGSAVITKGFALSKYIIHTVGPIWQNKKKGERNVLYACYRNSLTLAKKQRCKSIAFPLISSGVGCYPNDKALRVAVKAIGDFLSENEMDVSLVIYNEDSFQLSSKKHSQIQTFIKNNYNVTQYEKIDQSEYEVLKNIVNAYRKPNEFQQSGINNILDIIGERTRVAFTHKTNEPYHVPQRKLEDIVNKPIESFQQMLFRLIDERQERYPEEHDSDIYKRVDITRSVFSAIRSKQNYQPTKDTAIRLSISLQLSVDVTLDLLGRAGYTLSPSSVHDLIIRYFITEKIYDLYEINETLFLYGQRCLGERTLN
jgi:O-acetyl-ADP-ribose deacetylase (regulator of RNase III)